MAQFRKGDVITTGAHDYKVIATHRDGRMTIEFIGYNGFPAVKTDVGRRFKVLNSRYREVGGQWQVKVS